MVIKGLIDEDFTNYKKPSMFIIFPYCSCKCEKESGVRCCQNSDLAKAPEIDVNIEMLVKRYMNNKITSAVVCGGMEPFDSWKDLKDLVIEFRKHTNDHIVIYTGFYKNEIVEQINWLHQYPNIICKFGRFIPDKQPHYDKVLGIELASDNQYAEVIS